MCKFSPTTRSRVRLSSGLATYDKAFVYRLIDEVPICHVSTVVEGTPYLQATVHWRIGDRVYMHAAVKNKIMKAVNKGEETCLSFSDFGGFILARSAFNHAVMYRSAIAFCKGRFVKDVQERNELLKAFIESVQPGRWDKVRQPTTEELKRTGIIEFELHEVSAKCLLDEAAAAVLPGGKMEIDEDKNYSPWTGILPYKLEKQSAVESPAVAGIAPERS